MTIPTLDIDMTAVAMPVGALGAGVAVPLPSAAPVAVAAEPADAGVPAVVAEIRPPVAAPVDGEAVLRFREAMERPLAENARLQGLLNRALAHLAAAPRTEVVPDETLLVAANLAPRTAPKEVVVEAGVVKIREAPLRPEVEAQIVAKTEPVVAQPVVSEADVAGRAVSTTPPSGLVPAHPVAALRTEGVPNKALGVAANLAPGSAPKEVVVEAGVVKIREAPLRPEVEAQIAAKTEPVVAQPVVSEADVAGRAVPVTPPTDQVADATAPRDEEVVLQALPQTATVVPAAEAPSVRAAEPVVAPPVVDRVEQVKNVEMQMLVAAAHEVADAILVSPGLLRGQGEIRVQLKPEVLSGTEISIKVTGRTMSVEFQPTVQDAAVLIERNLAGLQERLQTSVAAFDIAVSVRSGVIARRASVRRTEEEA